MADGIEKLASLFAKEPKSEMLEGIWGKDSTSLPMPMNLEEFYDFTNRINTATDVIRSTDNPRLIVLETWLIIDFIIRQLLYKGLELERFLNKDLSFLPTSTDACIDRLQKFIKDQQSKPKPPMQLAMTMQEDFFSKIRKQEDFFKKLCLLEEEYYKEKYPEYNGTYVISNDDNNFRQVSDMWINTVNHFDDKWFKKIRRINTVRNKAAHSDDVQDIFDELGIRGKNKTVNLRKICFDILNQVLNIQISPKKS